MVRRLSEQERKTRPEMYGGRETVQVRNLLNGPDEMGEKGRLFSVLTVPVGGSIGWHVHENEGETFYILSGTGEFNDNGTPVPCGPGDVAHTPAGHGHAMKNTGDIPLEFVALILYA